MDQIEKIRKKALNNLYYFSKEILGYKQMETQPHQELCDFITSPEKLKKLILLPRSSFKSSVATISYPLWRLMRNPDERILISSESFGQSKTFLSAIKQHIEENELFRLVFGDHKKTDSVWRQEEITVAGRKKVAREPSIMASGVGQQKTGLHYDIIILDDVVSDKTIGTPEQIQKTLNHYRLLLSILDPGKEMTIIGTRYHFADLYGHILENDVAQFATLLKAAIDTKGKLYFPSRLTKEFLDIQKKSQGSQIFANQYMNSCVDQDSALFKKQWLRYYKEGPTNKRHFLLIDPASTDNKNSDFSGVIVCGIDHKNNIFVEEAINLKDTAGALVNLAFEKVAKYNIQSEGSVALEVNANQNTYQYIFSEEMNKRNFFFPIHELRPNSTRSKLQKIKALQPWFENGRIYLKKDQQELINQILFYPRTRHDDLIDSLSSILQVMSPANPETKPEKYEGSKLTQNELSIWKNKDELGKRLVKRTKYLRL